MDNDTISRRQLKHLHNCDWRLWQTMKMCQKYGSAKMLLCNVQVFSLSRKQGGGYPIGIQIPSCAACAGNAMGISTGIARTAVQKWRNKDGRMCQIIRVSCVW